MSFDITGKLIDKLQTLQTSEKFRKREFVVEYQDNPNSMYSELLKFQLTNDRCEMIDPFNLGQEIKVSFNLKGRKWVKDNNVTYFTNLEAWRIEAVGSANNAPAAQSIPEAGEIAPQGNDDLPF
ncbi:MAG: DUF3127 domain-containing protein [Lentimicrobiaceae bacterium]|jgi:hypothetical protein|nr:DUF3127 domain-containing protein [Lentimicrobiaceae bacterium]MDD4597040.1 DUF3127 domain-containing protein [Lentimicrobiaceae bacterium]MDY0024799.1 DUF3127 domain-containing protein [Lentimicrobium sp.]